jgi:hypothetical protein
MLWLLFSISLAQQGFIKNVPDYSQPPDNTLPSTIDQTNYCAPFAFLNIVEYWDSVQVHPYAIGAMAGLPGDVVAEYIGWFMDTNNQGDTLRENGRLQPPAKGTYAIDQWMGAEEYIIFDTLNTFNFPYTIPPGKRGYGWDIQQVNFEFLSAKDEIDQGFPVKLDFRYWNIWPTGAFITDPEFSDDTVHIYEWGELVNHSGTVDERDPVEQWNLEAGEGGIGHAVTMVGYLENYKMDTNYVVVHDNWSNTHRNIAVPWLNTHIASWMSIHLPEPPDLTVSNMRTAIDTSFGYTDSLWVGKPVTVCNTIKNLGIGPAAAYIITIEALDPHSMPEAIDTLNVTQWLNLGDSIVVCFDSLFVPQETGTYTITSHVYWDQNNDGLINDPSDADSLNDSKTINRTAYLYSITINFSIIPNVPDINQPPTTILTSTIPTNFCAPISAVNITTYWDVVMNHTNAQGVNAGLPPETAAEYIGWFMDTNNKGNMQANNGTAVYPNAPGTYTVDQDSFLAEYIRWDASHLYLNAPALPPSKNGYDWTFDIDYSTGINYFKNEINSELPAKIDFTHWNIFYTDTIFVDTLTQDTVYLYNWGPPLPNSGGEPWEEWNHLEGAKNIGHAVTGVGYFNYGINNTFYAIVHDNWQTTPKNIAVPWNYWVATLSISPVPPVFISDEAEIIREFRLLQNYPNPFNPTTVIPYQLPKKCKVELKIYNLLGEEIRTLVNHTQTAGAHAVVWNGRNQTGCAVSAGIYICCLKAGKKVQSRKIVFLK